MRTLLSFQLGAFVATGFLNAGLLLDDKLNVGAAVNLADNNTLDWFWYQTFYPDQGVANPIIYPRDGHPYDIRSKRRSSDMGRTAMLCLANHNAAATLPVSFSIRQLVALP
jgi:hypothetical protein